MPTFRYPVLVVRDPAGAFTAVAVEQDGLAGFGPTPADARNDLKAYLEWVHRKKPWETTVLVEAVREVEKRLAEAAKTDGRIVPPRRFWQTAAGRIIAGMKYLGQ